MENDEPRISIIVPVYNAENYIHRFIECCREQTLNSFEVIFINDGSSDTTQSLLEDYQIKYSNWLRLYSQNNQGVSSARNVGLKKAKGEFIFFADIDDLFSKRLLEVYVDSIEKSDADIVFFKISKYDYELNYLNDIHLPVTLLNKYFSNYDAFKLLMLQQLNGYPFGFISKSKIWKNIEFDKNIHYQEDVDAILSTLQNVESIHVEPCSEYYYIQNKSSVLHNMTIQHYKNALMVVKKAFQNKLIIKYPRLKQYVKLYEISILNQIIIKSILDNETKEFLSNRSLFMNKFWKAKINILKFPRRYVQYFLIATKQTKIIKMIYSKKV